MANNFERQVTTLANFGVDALVCADVEDGIEVADHKLSFVVPKGKVVTAVAFRNMKDNLVGAGASVQIKLGEEALGAPVAVANIKGKTAYTAIEGGYVLPQDEAITLSVTGGALTAGDLDAIVLYF